MALPTIMAGVNQTIMMALSMVVIAAMISAGGLGEIVLKGITQMKIGLGFEGGNSRRDSSDRFGSYYTGLCA